jgi:hypothetical protein
MAKEVEVGKHSKCIDTANCKSTYNSYWTQKMAYRRATRSPPTDYPKYLGQFPLAEK